MTDSAAHGGGKSPAIMGLLDAVSAIWPARRKVAPVKGKAQAGYLQAVVKPSIAASDDRSDGGSCRRLGDIDSLSRASTKDTLSLSNSRNGTKGSSGTDLCSLSTPLSLATTEASLGSPRRSGSSSGFSSDNLSPTSAASSLSLPLTKASRAGSKAACWQHVGRADSRRSHTETSRLPKVTHGELGRKSWAADDFEVVKTIGSGFMGSVRVVRLTGGRSATPFALKVMPKKKVIERKQETHVMQEKALLSQVSHPFVVRLVATFQDSANLYMLMEYVPGGELWSLLKNYGKARRSEAKFFAAEVVLALGHLHSMDIAYRDLKPENILLDVEGHVKLVDFGFAKVVTKPTWTKCGTAEYMAPEIIAGKGHGMPVDWWALGILIFEMLTGKSPFAAPTHYDVHMKVLGKEPQYTDHFTSNARKIVCSLLCKKAVGRLGCDGGDVEEVKRHPWFESMDWDAILQRRGTGPLVPNVKDESDTSFYHNYPEVDVEPGTAGGVPDAKQALFEGF